LLKQSLFASFKDLPAVGGPGRAGRIGSSESHHLMKNMIKDTMRDEDPREALLKFAREAEENPSIIGHVYKVTQPKTVFAEPDSDEEDRDVVRRP
jgi:hypothetical protein